MGEAIHDLKRLKELQGLSLERKIMITQAKIIEWYQYYNGNVYISLSGGKDSTVLLDIARKLYPDIKAVFVNTGLEYPEVREFALSFPNVDEIYPEWGRAGKKYNHKPEDRITFRDIVTIYGYPVISKIVSNAIALCRNKQSGTRWDALQGKYERRDGKKSWFDYSHYMPIYHLPFRISDKCCSACKKKPLHKYASETGKVPIIATMATESHARMQAWITTGCNAFDAKEPMSKPISFWREKDVLEYIRRYRIPIASVYGEVKVDTIDGSDFVDTLIPNELMELAPLRCTGCKRTGCIYCAYGFHLEKGETRFQMLAKTHPKLYEYCIGGGEWTENENYDPNETNPDVWNPKQIWNPSKEGLGMGKVFDMINEVYGEDFMRYKP